MLVARSRADGTGRDRGILVVLAVAAALVVAVPSSSCGLGTTGDTHAATGTKPPGCSETVSSVRSARAAVLAASGGEVVCLAAGSHGEIDLTSIDKPIANPVTFRGAANRATSVSRISFGGASGLVLEGFRIRFGVDSANQAVTNNITIRLNNIGGIRRRPNDGADAIHAIGAWPTAGQHAYLVERNYIHDTSGYGIRAQGDTPSWTVRYNKFERIGDADYIQSGFPADWVIDHNWFLGPSFRTYEDAHPDLWQSLDPNPPGTSVSFTNNRVHQTDGVTLGFIFGDTATDDGSYHHVRIVNNLMNRMADGEACQLANSIGLTFERNTIRAGANGWACRFGQIENSPASGYSIKRNVLTDSEVSLRGGPGHIICGPDHRSCAAVSRGRGKNVSDDRSAAGPGSIRGWKPKWSSDGWFRAQGLPFAAGHSLTPDDFAGWPFPPDTDAPQTTIAEHAPRRSQNGKVRFRFASDERDSSFDCKLDRKPFRSCISPCRLRRLGEGKHRFQVRAVDAAGNVDPSAAKHEFKVVG